MKSSLNRVACHQKFPVFGGVLSRIRDFQASCWIKEFAEDVTGRWLVKLVRFQCVRLFNNGTDSSENVPIIWMFRIHQGVRSE